jgi:hypothetical protein
MCNKIILPSKRGDRLFNKKKTILPYLAVEERYIAMKCETMPKLQRSDVLRSETIPDRKKRHLVINVRRCLNCSETMHTSQCETIPNRQRSSRSISMRDDPWSAEERYIEVNVEDHKPAEERYIEIKMRRSLTCRRDVPINKYDTISNLQKRRTYKYKWYDL